MIKNKRIDKNTGVFNIIWYGVKYEVYELKQHIYATLLRKGYPNGWIQEKMEETKWKRSKN